MLNLIAVGEVHACEQVQYPAIVFGKGIMTRSNYGRVKFGVTLILNCLKRPKAGYRVVKALYGCAEIRLLIWLERRRVKKAFQKADRLGGIHFDYPFVK